MRAKYQITDTELTAAQAAELCGVHPTTVKKWIAVGDLPARQVGLRSKAGATAPYFIEYADLVACGYEPKPLVAAAPRIEIDIPPQAWEPTGDADPTGRLTATVFINDRYMRAVAIAVAMVNGEQTAIGEWPEDLDALYTITAAGEPFDTVHINGRDYVIAIVPC